ncbi:MAG: hypothetical protein ACTHLT_05795 [Devosia sp.]
MAKTALERKRKQLEREARERRQMPDASYPYLRTPFFKHLENNSNWMNVELNFDLMGMPAPTFDDDRGPSSQSGQVDEDQVYAGYSGSIGRAEVMIGQLLDAAAELASIVNRYKLRELEARANELKQLDFADPEKRQLAMDEAVRLSQLQAHLEKNVRRTLPEWSLKGV